MRWPESARRNGLAVADQVDGLVTWVWVLGILNTLGAVIVLSVMAGQLVVGIFAALPPVVVTAVVAALLRWAAAMLRLSAATYEVTAHAEPTTHHTGPSPHPAVSGDGQYL